MPTHDIIDNRKEKLVEHVNRILSSSQAARFAVGYFFLELCSINSGIAVTVPPFTSFRAARCCCFFA